ncbi:MAG TPA: hypothetical protein VED46_17660 [Alphaproteobacteria bacterium]|nr:hypothetical protein [Alphaproteobacteria bacterium]
MDRLLPVSVPARFFAAGLGFHLLAWLAVAATAEWIPGFAGGLGPPLAALHLLTLGALCMVTIGALLQILPVALKTHLPSPCAPRVVFWMLLVGVPLLSWGMASGRTISLSLGGMAVSAGLLVFAAIAGRLLLHARGSWLVTVHVWASLAALLALVVLGLALLGDFVHGWLPDHAALAGIHLAVASYGFLGLLILGLSQVLVPMFALSPNPSTRLGWAALGLALGALALVCTGLAVPGATVGLAAALVHALAMLLALRRRVRRRLGPSFAMIALGWAMLPTSLILGGMLAAGALPARLAPLFGLALIGGWLLSTVLGMLMRILPFLATLHATKNGRRVSHIAALGDERLLWIQVMAHLVALLLVGLGAGLERAALISIGALVGAAGAGAFLLFAALVFRRGRILSPRGRAGDLAKESA